MYKYSPTMNMESNLCRRLPVLFMSSCKILIHEWDQCCLRIPRRQLRGSALSRMDYVHMQIR